MTSAGITAVLSGGGAKAAAHLGAVQAMREAGLTPTRYVGTSMGAVMAAALAGGAAPDEVLARMRGIRRRDVISVSPASLLRGWLSRALLRGDPLRSAIAQCLTVDRFDRLECPLTVTATDVEGGEQVLFGAGGEDAPLLDALYASCALPLLYPAAHLGGRRLADGGLRGPVPLRVAARFPADRVIAVDVGPAFEAEAASKPERVLPLVRVWNDASRVMMAGISELELALWRQTSGRPPLVYIRPPTERGATFAVEQFDRYFSIGFEAARQSLRA